MGFGSKKKDICWDIMRSWYIAQDTERYNKLKEAFQSGNLPDGYYGEIRANGIFCYGECAYANGETLDEYHARIGIPKSWKYPIGVSDIVDADEWLSKMTSASEKRAVSGTIRSIPISMILTVKMFSFP